MSAGMPLLSTSETFAFPSFLSDVNDRGPFDIASEWSMYYDKNDLAGPGEHGDRRGPERRDDDFQRERLTKATKDLMSLDGTWADSGHVQLPPIPEPPSPSPSPPPQRRISALRSLLSDDTIVLPPITARPPQNRSERRSKVHSPSISSHQPQQSRVWAKFFDEDNSSTTTQRPSAVIVPKRSRPEDDTGSSATPTPALSSSISSTSASTSTAATTPPDPEAQPQKKARRTTALQHLSGQTVLHAQPKQAALLSASQKKANHIQSEQKRRANIRRGYEALCETVPALREAIRAEEEQTGMSINGSGNVPESQNSGATKKRRRKNAKPGDDMQDKSDGRVGPRSENMVLQKTIDYINILLSEHSTLKARLQRAKDTALARGLSHVLYPMTGTINGLPLWEREWNGGTGIDDGDVEADGGDSDDEDNEP